MTRVITFIDGFNLYYGMRDAYQRKYLWLNLLALSRKLLKPGQQLVHCHYFTARVSNPSDKRRRQVDYLEALETLAPDLDITYGKYFFSPVECPLCHRTYQKASEKMTDVNIATRMLVDVIQDNFDTCILVSGDSDLSSPITQIKNLFPQKRIIIAFPPRRNSAELKRVAHGYFKISENKLRNSQFPEFVSKANGYQLQRPQSWN